MIRPGFETIGSGCAEPRLGGSLLRGVPLGPKSHEQSLLLNGDRATRQGCGSIGGANPYQPVTVSQTGQNNPLRGWGLLGLRPHSPQPRILTLIVADSHADCRAASRFDFQRNAASIAREAALDGIYVIRTSVSADVMSETEAVSAYKDLSRVERAFRTLKSVDLAIRPVHHWLSPRVRAHVFLCMMAYYVEWHLRDALKPLLFQDHDRPGAEPGRSSPVAPASTSPAADRKRGRRRNDQNLPISSFTDLMAHLATQTLNTAALPKAPNATFTTLANPTPLQAAAFDLIGIDPMRVQ